MFAIQYFLISTTSFKELEEREVAVEKRENEVQGKNQQMQEREGKCLEREKKLEAREREVVAKEEKWIEIEKRMQQNAAKLPTVIRFNVGMCFPFLNNLFICYSSKREIFVSISTQHMY